jgi:DNA-binding GntR family transcriptional regulator
MTLLDIKPGSTPRSATEVAADIIRQAIVQGRLKPGQQLKAGEIAAELGISRTPVREALLVLHAEGLVAAPPNRTATVRTSNAKDIDDLYQLRAVLEGHAARLAAPRIQKQDVAALRESCERLTQLRSGEDVRELIQENATFHDAIVALADSDRLRAAIALVELPYLYRSYFWFSAEQKRISEHYHREITKALEIGDAERAEFLMKAHLLEARDFLVSELITAEE